MEIFQQQKKRQYWFTWSSNRGVDSDLVKVLKFLIGAKHGAATNYLYSYHRWNIAMIAGEIWSEIRCLLTMTKWRLMVYFTSNHGDISPAIVRTVYLWYTFPYSLSFVQKYKNELPMSKKNHQYRKLLVFVQNWSFLSFIQSKNCLFDSENCWFLSGITKGWIRPGDSQGQST